ncbi:hypothetical protein V6N13_004908 [Hibiscus sabdariffa]|uniref:Uncharacterized protein n=1 Tax=Hibiscus sabdariffa TaxID=183260 RepID=A0ABR2S0Q7_9ROSI
MPEVSHAWVLEELGRESHDPNLLLDSQTNFAWFRVKPGSSTIHTGSGSNPIDPSGASDHRKPPWLED